MRTHMKRKFYCWMTALAVLSVPVTSCSDDPEAKPDISSDGVLTAPVLTLSASGVTVDTTRPDDEALRVSWSAATDDEEIDVRYALYVNRTDGDMFTDPVVLDAGAECTYVFTNLALNRLLLSDFGAEPDVATPLRLAVYARNSDEEFDTRLSEIVACEVTPRTTYPAWPPSLLLVGAATDWGWSLPDALEIPETTPGSRIYEAADVVLHVQPVSLNNGFKCYFSRNENDTDDPRFAAQDLASEQFGRIALYKQGDAQFQPGTFGFENGLYAIRVDLHAMQLTLTRTGDLPEPALPERLYLLGDPFDWGWTWDGTPLEGDGDGIYRAENVHMTFGDNGDRGFKMYAKRDDWSVYYAMTDDATADDIALQRVTDSEAPQVYPGKLGFADGTYDIVVDLVAMKLTLTSRIDYSTACSMTGEATPGGWETRTYLTRKSENEWEATGVAMNFSDEYKGFKIFASADGWWPWYGQQADAAFGTVVRIDDQAASDAAGDPQFYPQRSGYASGVYTVNLNLNTMKLTLTRED